MADASKISFGGTAYDLKDAAARTSLTDKLDKVTTMPSSPVNGQTVMFVGTTTSNYTKGHTYQYQTNAWVDISPAGGGTVDQTYDPTSVNAQSGKAVAGAIAPVKETAQQAATDSYVARNEIGDISALETTDQSDLVSAINELVHAVALLKDS